MTSDDEKLEVTSSWLLFPHRTSNSGPPQKKVNRLKRRTPLLILLPGGVTDSSSSSSAWSNCDSRAVTTHLASTKFQQALQEKCTELIKDVESPHVTLAGCWMARQQEGTSSLSAIQLYTQFPSKFQLNLKATEQGGDTDVVVSNESRLLRPQMAKTG